MTTASIKYVNLMADNQALANKADAYMLHHVVISSLSGKACVISHEDTYEDLPTETTKYCRWIATLLTERDARLWADSYNEQQS